jgi:hypothetical protein
MAKTRNPDADEGKTLIFSHWILPVPGLNYGREGCRRTRDLNTWYTLTPIAACRDFIWLSAEHCSCPLWQKTGADTVMPEIRMVYPQPGKGKVNS